MCCKYPSCAIPAEWWSDIEDVIWCVQNQADPQKRADWSKRLGDIVGISLLAEYQATVQVGEVPCSLAMKGLAIPMCLKLLAQECITGRLLRSKPRLHFSLLAEASSALVRHSLLWCPTAPISRDCPAGWAACPLWGTHTSAASAITVPAATLWCVDWRARPVLQLHIL